MMRHLLIASALVVVGVVAVVFVVDAFFGWVLIGGIGAAGLAAQLGRCRHPHPALQPATVDHFGRHSPAHWYCDDCGRRWAASFEHESRPIQRFAGFDPSKAVDAARRADELETRRREMALVRAGLSSRRAASGPVPIHEHRPSVRLHG
jgi:hypothetical protein